MDQGIMYSAFVDELTKIGSITEEDALEILKEAGLLSAVGKGLKGLKPGAGWQSAAKMSPGEVAKLGPRGVLKGGASKLAPAGAGATSRVKGMGLSGRLGAGGSVGRGSLA